MNDEEFEEAIEGVWGNTHKIDSKELKPTVSNNGKKCIVNFDVSTGKTKYSCVNCGKTSNDRSNLWNHILCMREENTRAQNAAIRPQIEVIYGSM